MTGWMQGAVVALGIVVIAAVVGSAPVDTACRRPKMPAVVPTLAPAS